MLDHVSITVRSIEASLPFYDATMAALGHPRVWREERAAGYGLRADAAHPERSYLTLREGLGGPPDRRHWAFKAGSRAAVDGFHAAGLAAGGACDGPPGPRPAYHAHYYAAFLLDPDGNRLEAACHRPD